MKEFRYCNIKVEKGKASVKHTKGVFEGRIDHFKIRDIENWYYHKEKEEFKITKWLSVLILVIFMILMISLRNFLVFVFNVEEIPNLWKVVENIIFLLFGGSFTLLMIWMIIDWIGGFPFIQTFLIRITRRRRNSINFEIGKNEQVKIRIINKTEGRKIADLLSL